MNTTRFFIACNNDSKIREESSSGGIFYLLARKTILNGGIVFGAAFDENWQVHHIACETIEELPGLMRSKYVQSAMEQNYKKVCAALNSQRQVLFCGTPCQVSGLMSYLNAVMKDTGWREKLIAIDFICHGVPSPLVWRNYLKEISGGRRIASVNFRDKTMGWKNYCLKICFSDGNYYLQSKQDDLFLQGFVQDLYLREACYECTFRGVDRISDITLGDFWGASTYFRELDDDKGLSVVMTHNSRAFSLLEELEEALTIQETEGEIIERTNPIIVRSAKMNPLRARFMKRVGKKKTTTDLKVFTGKTLFGRVLKKFYRLFR